MVIAHHALPSADSWKTTGARTPADALGATKRMSTLDGTAIQSGDHECPECGDAFDTKRGVSVHYSQIHGGSIAKSTYTCDRCGDEYEQYDCLAKQHSDRTFCSRGCKEEWQADWQRGENNPFWKGGKSCQLVTCTWCGGEIERPGWYLDKYERSFCDQGCKGEWVSENRHGEDHWLYDGGVAEYGPGWTDRKKERVRERDNYECQGCEMSQADHEVRYDRRLEVHHIVPAKQFDGDEAANKIENLVTTCVPCHRRAERYAPLNPFH